MIVWKDPSTPRIIGQRPGAPAIPNYQIRYYLAGLERPHFVLQNARFKFVGRGAPELDRWVRFEIPVKEDFRQLWGVVPSGYEYLRVLFEARWDDKPAGAGVRADVYYDDLYLGPAKAE